MSSSLLERKSHIRSSLPGGPAGTMALNETHHLTPFGTVNDCKLLMCLPQLLFKS